jgi:hypothetical protein
VREHNHWLQRAIASVGVTNVTLPAARLQSFFLALRRDAPTLPGSRGAAVVAPGVNLHTRAFRGLYNATVNGRAGERDTGNFTFVEMPGACARACVRDRGV